MVHPLVDDSDRSHEHSRSCHGVFSENGKAERIDHLRDAVIDLRIDVIRSAGKDYTLDALLLHLLEDSVTFSPDIFLVLAVFGSTCLDRSFRFLVGYCSIVEALDEIPRHSLEVIKRHERIDVVDV